MGNRILLVAAILCLGCGSPSGGNEDSGTDTLADTITTDETPDTLLDPPVDLQHEGDEDVLLDGVEDAGDVVEDPAADASPDVPDLITVPVTDAVVLLDPYDAAPLSAVIVLEDDLLHPDDVTGMDVAVHGIDAGAEDLTAHMDPRAPSFAVNFDVTDLLSGSQVGVPVLGLYADASNIVDFDVQTDTHRFTGQVEVTTRAVLPLEGAVVTVDIMDAASMAPGFTYIDNYVFDHQGHIRWTGPPVTRVLQDGNILSRLHEISWLGRTLHTWNMPPEISWHHDATELPGGNIVFCAHDTTQQVVDSDGTTVDSNSDYVVEFNRSTGAIVNAWDLRHYLDTDRGTVVDGGPDWLHMNSITYDPVDDAILVSNRYQGIVKLTRGGLQGPEANRGKEMVWILSPHLDWGPGGWDGTGPVQPADLLLTAVDSSGSAYPDAVQDNLQAPDASEGDFHWAIGQHGLAITHHAGDVMRFLTFDNQASFIFDGEGTVDNGVSKAGQGDLTNDRSDPPYSLLVEYEVNESFMTVTQVWSHGAHMEELYGSRNSGVWYDPATGNRMLFTNGLDPHSTPPGPMNPHVIEFNSAGEPIYRLEITNTTVSTLHAGRVDLYHPDGS